MGAQSSTPQPPQIGYLLTEAMKCKRAVGERPADLGRLVGPTVCVTAPTFAAVQVSDQSSSAAAAPESTQISPDIQYARNHATSLNVDIPEDVAAQ